MKRVIIESPFASGQGRSVEQNVAFARAAMKYALNCGCAPLASHLLYPGILDDSLPEERSLGIACGLAWASVCDEVWICLPEGVSLSAGMKKALAFHEQSGVRVVKICFTEDGVPIR